MKIVIKNPFHAIYSKICARNTPFCAHSTRMYSNPENNSKTSIMGIIMPSLLAFVTAHKWDKHRV